MRFHLHGGGTKRHTLRINLRMKSAMSEIAAERVDWERFDFSAQDGLALAGRKYGWANRGATAVLCLAGLTRNSADFHELAKYLAHDAPRPRKVLCLDYRGRGMSARDREWKNYNPLSEANDVLSATAAAGIREAAVIGTSRGGMVAMLLAAVRPALLKAVILNDVGPEIDGRGLVRIRAYVENGRDYGSWQEAAESLRAANEASFPGLELEDWISRAQLIYEEKAGRIVRAYDPALMKTLSAINLDIRLPSMWPQFNGLARLPVMVVRGERSDLLSRETVDKMHDAHPGLWSITVPEQGHAPDLGWGDLPRRVGEFLEQVDDPAD